MNEPVGFGARLQRAFERYGHLCVGIDPHGFLLEQWGLGDDAPGARAFGLSVVEAAAGRVGIVKPQVAFFERFGSAGYRALEDVLAAAHAAGLLVIADVKRGDVGSSVQAYGGAWLKPGSALEADAMTITAFQGVGSIAAVMALAQSAGKGLFVLAATSNPEAAIIQQAQVRDKILGSRSVSRVIIDDVTRFNARHSDEKFGSIGVVLGATLDLKAFGVDVETPLAPVLPVLAPGFGHQGAQVADAAEIFGALLPGTVISQSRTISAAGPDGIADAIARESKKVQDAVG